MRDRYDLYEHGSRVECLKSIMLEGLCDSRISRDKRFWGSRVLESVGAQGVYTYSRKDSISPGNGYSQWSHMFGDGWFWSPSFLLIADYKQRIRPTVRKQVVSGVSIW